MSWKIISETLFIFGTLMALWVIYEIRVGVAQTRSGPIIWSENPQGCWDDIAMQIVSIAMLFFFAFKAWRQGQREPNF